MEFEGKVSRYAVYLISILKSMNKSNMRIAEIGVHKARTSTMILLNCNDIISEYIGIDPLLACKQFNTYSHGTEMYISILEKMRKYPQFNLIRAESASAYKLFPDRYFDFIFIDADHSYVHVYEDINLWMPKLKENSILTGHDYCRKFPGVVKAVHEIFGEDCERGPGTLFVVRFGEFANGKRIEKTTIS